MGSFMSSNLARTGYPVLGLDTNVSGDKTGARDESLYMFGGGDEATFQQCLPILTVLGNPQKTLYCGPSGAEKRWRDSMGRPTVSYWHELTHRKASEE